MTLVRDTPACLREKVTLDHELADTPRSPHRPQHVSHPLLALVLACTVPALHIRDVPEETVAAIKRRAARRGHSVQQELREVLQKAAAEAAHGARPRRLTLRTVTTGRSEGFDRSDFYDDDGR